MEQDLRDISSELASSIRREIDLEDLVDRLQLEASNGAGHNRRTSDYFSDAGMSFAKFSIGDSESRELEVEKQLRKAEQEKAQLRLRLTQKAQDERIWRKGLEQQVLQLQEMLDKVWPAVLTKSTVLICHSLIKGGQVQVMIQHE